MSSSNFEELSWHIGHDVEVVSYGKGGYIYNIAIECNDCGTVLLDFENPKNVYLERKNGKETSAQKSKRAERVCP